MAILNTHAVVKKFTQHGFTEEHAELIVDAINSLYLQFERELTMQL